MCSFSSKKSANGALFSIIHTEAMGVACFSIVDMTLLNGKIQSWLWTRGSCDVSCTSIIVLMRRSS